MPSSAQLEGVWSEQDTTPSAIESALHHLLVETYEAERAHAPARVLNLVVIVDRQFKGEITNRLERLGRYHPSRTILCAVERGRTTMDAWAQVTADIPDTRPVSPDDDCSVVPSSRRPASKRASDSLPPCCKCRVLNT